MFSRYRLFERFGVELEYMIVDARTLSVRPWADRLIRRECGDVNGDITRGSLAWSNELALHVIEFKTARPAPSIDRLAARFQAEVRHANHLLSAEGACLLPTAMHPWMNPLRESRLWPHECGPIYRAFHRIFNCRGHGWTNLQSAHLNLPFSTIDEFERLHTAIRLILPLLPALAASSPFVEGVPGPMLDMRLDAYRRNCTRIPAITAGIIPDWTASPDDYHARILKPIYRALSPLDPEGTLQHEWVNARGAIARFQRGSIEIRVLDLQECPAADLAILHFVIAILRRLTDGSLSDPAVQRRIPTRDLARWIRGTVRSGGRCRPPGGDVPLAFGITGRRPASTQDVLNHLLHSCVASSSPASQSWQAWIHRILEHGTLAERILQAAGSQPTRAQLRSTYRRLADCLAHGCPFEA